MLERRALRADPVCCFVELAVNFFVQSFMLPCCATAFNDSSGTNIGMGFRSVITDTDCYIVMERANRCRAHRRQRISNDRSETVGPAIHGHKRPLSATSRSFFFKKQITKIMPHFDADQSSILPITVIFGPARLIVAAFCRSSANVSVGSKSDLTSWNRMSVSPPKADVTGYDSSSGLSMNPWLSTSLPFCMIGT
jgi:hypothetical protein